MTRMAWDTPTDRTYQNGVDRGVLHVHDGPVVSWPGIVSVSEASKGGEIKPVYQDGFRIHNYTTIREFEANLEAISHPDEFNECNGIGADEAALGLYVDQQAPKMFDLAYRTGVGSSLEPSGADYKLHLVYNCLVEPDNKMYKTRSDTPEIVIHNWVVVTVPRRDILTVTPSAHYIIDSRRAEESRLEQLEDILYGTDVEEPRFLDPLEVQTILSGG